jgi:3-(3-hydroxy-phenyl)propionate hydroxylase
VVGPYVRFEFMLRPGEGIEMQEPERVRALLAEWVDPSAVRVIRSAVYRFHALLAARWRSGPVLVAGDAAHQMPPFLGQGMCAGIRDAANLAWKLRLVLAGAATPALLDSYAEERAPHVRGVIATAVRMGRIICTQDPELARTRDAQLLARSGPGEASGAAPAGPPGLPDLAAGLLEPAPRHALAGALALQARVRDGAGCEALLDDVIGPGFTLLWRGRPAALGEAARAVCRRLGVRQVGFDEVGAALAGRAAPPGDAAVRVLGDPQGAYAEWLDRHGARAVLVRPDHAVFGAATATRAADALLADLARALSRTS